MPARKLREFLDRHNVKYITITHSPAYTAQGIAHSAHLSGHDLAKTVILNLDGKLAMAVLPASYRVDIDAVKHAVGAKRVEIAAEGDFATTFPGCEVGAMPPFGNLWDVPVYIAEKLTDHETIAFNAGTHTELVEMAYPDFERLVKPKIVPMTHAAV